MSDMKVTKNITHIFTCKIGAVVMACKDKNQLIDIIDKEHKRIHYNSSVIGLIQERHELRTIKHTPAYEQLRTTTWVDYSYQTTGYSGTTRYNIIEGLMID